MRLFNYVLDLSKLGFKEGEGKEVNHKVTFERYLETGLSALYSQGLDNKTRREYARILDKLDLSSDGTIKLEESEFDIINEVFSSEKAKFDPKQTRIVTLYIKALEGAQKL